MLEEPSSGSKRTAYLPTAVFGRDRDDVFVFLATHHADPAGVLQAVLDRLVGEHVELLLLLALHVLGALLAQDVDQAGPPDGRGDDLGRQGDVVEQIGQLPRGLGVAVLLVEDEALDGRDRRLHEAPGSLGAQLLSVARRTLVVPSAFDRTVIRRPSVDDGDRALAIGPVHRHAVAPEAARAWPARDGRSRSGPSEMTAAVGRERVEPGVAGAAAAAVMPHLEQVHPPEPAPHRRLRRESRRRPANSAWKSPYSTSSTSESSLTSSPQSRPAGRRDAAR